MGGNGRRLSQIADRRVSAADRRPPGAGPPSTGRPAPPRNRSATRRRPARRTRPRARSAMRSRASRFATFATGMSCPPASTPPMTRNGDAGSLLSAIFCMAMAPVTAGANVTFAGWERNERNAHAHLRCAQRRANTAAKVITACRKARRLARRARAHVGRVPQTVAHRLRHREAPGRRADSTTGADDERHAIPRTAIHATAFAPSCRESLRPLRHGRSDRARGRMPRAAAGRRRGRSRRR